MKRDMKILILFFLFFGCLTLIFFHFIKSQNKQSETFKQPEKPVKRGEVLKRGETGVAKRVNKQSLSDIYRDIKIEPYGCFINVKDKFFAKQINPYAKIKVYDSGIFIQEYHYNSEFRNLINNVINNGFDEYGYYLLKKYPKDDFTNITLKEIASLGKLAGYSYMSIYKLNEDSVGNVYLTYSPPMDKELAMGYTQNEYNLQLSKSDLPNHSLTPRLNKYTNEKDVEPGEELSCGYPCKSGGKFETLKDSSGNESHYMCGSTSYPDIKTPPRYAVYQIIETI